MSDFRKQLHSQNRIEMILYKQYNNFTFKSYKSLLQKKKHNAS